jgi:O-antigen ligase
LLTAFQISATAFSLLLIFNGQLYQGSRATLAINGQEQDPNNFSAMLVIPTLISFWKILNKQYIVILHQNFNFLNYLCLGFNIISMLMLGSRGGLFGLVCGVIFLVFFNNSFTSNNKASHNKLLALKIIFLVTVFLFFILPYIDPQTLQRLSAQRIEQDKGSDRLLIWDMAFTQFSHTPLFGMGIGSFQGVTKMGVHNQFIIVLVESGIIGVVLFLIPLIVLFKKTMKNKISLLPAILIGTFIVIFFLDAYNKKFFWNAIMISVIILRMAENSKKLLYIKKRNGKILNENINL